MKCTVRHTSALQQVRARMVNGSSAAARRAASRRRLRVGLAISFSGHAVILLWPVDAPRLRSPEERSALARKPTTWDEVRLLSIQGAVNEPTPLTQTEPGRPFDGETDERGAVERAPSSLALDEVADPGPIESAPRELGPHLSDSRLRARVDSSPAARFALERELGAYGIRKWLESESARPRRTAGMSAWTGGGDDGRTRGVSQGRIHLGSVVVPFCGGGGVKLADCGFGLTPGKRWPYEDWISKYDEIARQARRVAAEEIWRERAHAIRRRRNAERPDTSSHR